MDEVAVVRAVLASMGVADYDPKVATLLAEYLRRKSCVCVVGSREAKASVCLLPFSLPLSHTHCHFFVWVVCRERGRGADGVP